MISDLAVSVHVLFASISDIDEQSIKSLY